MNEHAARRRPARVAFHRTATARIAAVLVGAVTLGAAPPAHAGERPLTPADAAAGKPLYVRECSGCHGERGDGKGPAADFVDPRPRDFTASKFKFRTTPAGQPPATDDLLRVVGRGIPGTAMPSFAFLPEGERRQIVAYVLKLADLLDAPEPPPLEVGGEPATTPDTVAHGKQLFVDAGCVECHGQQGKGDGPSAKDLKDVSGRPISARDLTAGVYRGGDTRRDLFYRLMTGLDGTPMPSYKDAVDPPDLWALTDYVLSLRAPAAAPPRPADAIEAGRQIAAKYSCRGCHVLDDGVGGSVGPDLRVSAQKLHPEWVRTFLTSTREYGKVYPWRPWRMPKLPLSDDEITALTRYIAAMGHREVAPVPLPDVAKFPAATVEEGKNLYILRCTECHNLGNVIPTIPIKQQGPDLIRVAHRIDFEWAKRWITDPKKVDPNTKMTVPALTPEQVEAVRMFVWKTSIEAGPSSGIQAASAH
jgi:mono/diheme cytochrome c family protein